MNPTDHLESPSSHTGVFSDALRQLDVLRSRLSSSDSDDTAQHALTLIGEVIERVATEHTGLAEELLGVYEQLGIVFEVTAKLPSVQNESEMIDIFLDSLRNSFADREVFAVSPQTLSSDGSHGAGAMFGDWIETLVSRAKDRSCVVVGPPPADETVDRVSEVMVGPLFAGKSFAGAIVLAASPASEPFRASDMLLLEALTTFCGDLIRIHRLVNEVQGTSLTLVSALVNAVDQKDSYTSGHSVRVGYFAMLLGVALHLDEHTLEMLNWGALLHDVGKIGIRDDVLKKAGRLTRDEFSHIKEHPVRSHQVVRDVPQLAPALDGIQHHHERFDGTGYPDGLIGEAIPLLARIIQVADIFDALTSTRSYREAYPWQEALGILRKESGSSVDPRLQELFDRLIRERLGDSPGAWDRMIRRANRFNYTGGDESHWKKDH